MHTSIKNLVRDFDRLDEETLARIPDLNDPHGPGKAVHEAADRWQKAKAELSRIRRELAESSGDCPGGRPMLTQQRIAADAEHILNGGAVENIVEIPAQDYRQTLVRQLHALERAVPALEHRANEVQVNVIREQLAALEPAGEALYAELLGAYDHLVEHLEAWGQFCDLLGRRGFLLHLRESRWHLSEYEKMLLFGGAIQSLEHHAKIRAAQWPGLAKERN